VPIVGNHAKRVLSGVINFTTGTCLTHVTTVFRCEDFQNLLRRVRSCWRGWHIVLFIDRHSARTAGSSRRLAKALGVELRWLPTACPELNVIDTLWRNAKAEIVANEPNPDVDETVHAVIHYLEALTLLDRLRKAGILSDDFWMASIRTTAMSKKHF
jgi:transposase